jgi:hypothetical protein
MSFQLVIPKQIEQDGQERKKYYLNEEKFSKLIDEAPSQQANIAVLAIVLLHKNIKIRSI